MSRDAGAGVRIGLARDILGFSRYKLAKAWERFNLEKSGKRKTGLPITHIAITDWEENGVPLRTRTNNGKEPFGLLAEFFKVPKSAFIGDPEIWSEEKFITVFNKKARNIRTLNRKPPFQIPSPLGAKVINEQFKKIIAGFHWAYFLFPIINKNKERLNYVYKALIHVHEFDPEQNTINANLLGRDGMLFEGQVVLGIKKTTWFFTRFDEGDEYSQNSIFILTTPIFLDDVPDSDKSIVKDRLGIILSETTLPEQLKRDSQPLLTASRILIRRIPNSAAMSMEAFENEVAIYKFEDFEDETILSLIKNNSIHECGTLTHDGEQSQANR